MKTERLEESARKLVEEYVGHNITSLVSTLIENDSDEWEELRGIEPNDDTYIEHATENGAIIWHDEDGDWHHTDARESDYFTSEAEAARDWCESNSSPDLDSAYEYWTVSDNGQAILKQHGQKVVDAGSCWIWLRGGTGQSLYMDNVWQDIARERANSRRRSR